MCLHCRRKVRITHKSLSKNSSEIKHFQENLSLTELSICLYKMKNDDVETIIKIIQSLSQKKFLTTLEMTFGEFHYCAISDHEMSNIANSLSELLLQNNTLTELKLDFTSPSGFTGGCFPVIFESLKNNTSLTKLEYQFTRAHPKLFEAISLMLSSNRCLKTLILSEKYPSPSDSPDKIDMDMFTDSLHTNKTLEVISLSIQMTRDEFVAMITCLNHSNLLTIDINNFRTTIDTSSGGSISDTVAISNGANRCCMTAIVSLLESNKKLQTLKLPYNKMDWYDAKMLAIALESNETLQELDLSHNQIGTDGAIHLVTSLNTNTSLKKLTLSHNKIESDATPAISEMLKTNETLTHLILATNDLGCSRADLVADSLINNKTLLVLDLSCNYLGKDWISKLSKSLLINNTLQELNIGKNRIQSMGIMEIAEMISVNRSIRSLILDSDSSGNAECDAKLFEAALTNDFLQEFSFGSRHVSVDAIEKLLVNNYSITYLHTCRYPEKISKLIERNKKLQMENRFKRMKAVY